MTPAVRGLACILLAALAAFAAGCGGSTPEGDETPLRPATLQLNWFHEAEFVGYYVADAKGFYRDAGLDVTIREGGPGDPAIDTVLDGRSDFAVSSFGEQRDSVAAGRPTVAVMAAFQIPPLVIFSLSESGIARPADLAGTRVGVTTDYWRDVLRGDARGLRRQTLRSHRRAGGGRRPGGRCTPARWTPGWATRTPSPSRPRSPATRSGTSSRPTTASAATRVSCSPPSRR